MTCFINLPKKQVFSIQMRNNMKDYFVNLPHDQVFDKFFNQTEGTAGLCRQILNNSLSSLQNTNFTEKKDNSGCVADILFPNGEVLDYETYTTQDSKPYAVTVSYFSKLSHLYVVVRANEQGQLQVSARLNHRKTYEDGNTMEYMENYDEIHFSDKLFMFDHSVAYQSFPTMTKTKEEAEKVENGVALSRDFNIVKQGHRITRFYDATKVYREGVFPSVHYTCNERAKLVAKLIENLGQKKTAFYNEYEVQNESMNFYIAKNRKLFDEFHRDTRPFEDVVKYPKFDGALPINGMM